MADQFGIDLRFLLATETETNMSGTSNRECDDFKSLDFGFN